MAEMQGTQTYAYANTMPAKRDENSELDEWLNEALGEGFGFLEKDWAAAAEEDTHEAKLAAMAKDTKPAARLALDPAKRKSSMAGGIAKAGLGSAGIYQAVQALQALSDIGSDALTDIVASMDPAMVDIISQIGDAAGQLFEDQQTLYE